MPVIYFYFFKCSNSIFKVIYFLRDSARLVGDLIDDLFSNIYSREVSSLYNV